MKINEIVHIAKLSKLKLSPEELTHYSNQFENIMKMVNVISEVNTQDIQPMHNPFDQEIQEHTMRQDIQTKLASEELILIQPEDPYFYVPKVIE